MGRKVIQVGIDGCHQATLYKLIDSGEAKFLRKLVDQGVRVKCASTMFPATTVPCCTSLYTGCWYRNHGILDNEWMDRFTSPVRARSYINGLHYALESFDRKLFGWPTILLPDLNKGGAVNNDINPNTPTIYEEFTAAGKTSFTFFHYIGKGATRWIRPGRPDMIRYGIVEQYGKPYQLFEKMLVTRALRVTKKGLPDLLSIYFGGNDGNGHRHGVAGQLPYLRDFVDPELQRLASALEKRFPNDEICWAITADHGQTTMNEDDIKRCIWWDTFDALLKDAGYNNIDRSLSTSFLDPADAVVSLGNGAAIGFYLKNKKSADWKTHPDFETEMVPLLNNFLKASDLLAPFSDWQFPRYLDFLLTRTKYDEPYRVYVNKPPYTGVGELVSLEDFFKDRPGGYVHPIERLRGIDHPKGPDIKMHLNYIDHFNVNEVADFHPGQHGSLMEEDSLVPMIFSGPGIRKGEIEEAFTIDFSPTTAAMAGVSMKKADGKVLPIFEK